jgi:FKBP-type peptidyl-prolyl cis-trans isomerase SlpA
MKNTIQHNSLVTLHYSIAIIDNNSQKHQEIVNSFQTNMPATITIGYGNLPASIEFYLIDRNEDEELDIEIENAFGEYNPNLQQVVSQKLLDEHGNNEEYKVGSIVSFNTDKGGMAGTFMCKHQNSGFWFDFNHPLAGKKVNFKAKILSII